MSNSSQQKAAAMLGFFGVAAAAYGSHGLEKIASAEQVRWWAIAAAIQLVMAPALLALSFGGDRVRSAAGPFLLSGVCIFSGSLYAMALGAPRFFGAITPVGGLLLMMGWALAAMPRK